jgi:hypothetical protein
VHAACFTTRRVVAPPCTRGRVHAALLRGVLEVVSMCLPPMRLDSLFGGFRIQGQKIVHEVKGGRRWHKRRSHKRCCKLKKMYKRWHKRWPPCAAALTAPQCGGGGGGGRPHRTAVRRSVRGSQCVVRCGARRAAVRGCASRPAYTLCASRPRWRASFTCRGARWRASLSRRGARWRASLSRREANPPHTCINPLQGMQQTDALLVVAACPAA